MVSSSRRQLIETIIYRLHSVHSYGWRSIDERTVIGVAKFAWWNWISNKSNFDFLNKFDNSNSMFRTSFEVSFKEISKAVGSRLATLSTSRKLVESRSTPMRQAYDTASPIRCAPSHVAHSRPLARITFYSRSAYTRPQCQFHDADKKFHRVLKAMWRAWTTHNNITRIQFTSYRPVNRLLFSLALSNVLLPLFSLNSALHILYIFVCSTSRTESCVWRIFLDLNRSFVYSLVGLVLFIG